MKKERLDKFSIRKLTVGAASVLIGVAFGATTVSAAAKPAPQQDTPASQQAEELTELKGVKFTFKMGDKSATTRAVTIYATKDGHYGFEKDAAKCTSTAAQIVSTFLDSVSDDAIKNAQGVAYPEKIVAGENTVELAAQHASNKVEHSDADLQKEAEKKADELTNSPAFFKAELKDAEHDLQVAKDTVAQAEQEGSLSQEEMAKLQDDVAKAEAKVNELKNSSAFVEVQLKDAEHELEVAKDAVAQAEQEGGLSQEEMGKLQDEVAKAEAEVNELKAKLAKKVTPAPEPVTPTPAPVVSGETGIGYLNLDMLSDGFTGTLYVPVVGKDVNCKVRLLDDAGKYTNDYVVTDTTVKALASKVVNGVTFYKVAENRWIPAKFAEVLSDKEVAFKGVAKTFVKGHANYAVAMLDANGKYTGKFLKQGSSFKVFAKKVINGHLCYRLGTQAQWVPARFLVF